MDFRTTRTVGMRVGTHHDPLDKLDRKIVMFRLNIYFATLSSVPYVHMIRVDFDALQPDITISTPGKSAPIADMEI